LPRTVVKYAVKWLLYKNILTTEYSNLPIRIKYSWGPWNNRN